MKILITGGNGNISWWVTKKAIEQEHDVYVLNHKATSVTRRELPPEAIKIQCDIRNSEETQCALKDFYFDVVCDFICYNQEHALDAIELFHNRTNQYIFISSESIYKRETKYLPFKENTPLSDPAYSGKYIRGKIEAERVFIDAYEKLNFPVTIIRPSYTYDTLMPSSIGLNCFTAIQRYQIDNTALIAGDGVNLWTFTHAKDFANALLALMENQKSIGEDYHITSDEWLTWIDATSIILNHLELKSAKMIHIPRDIVLNTKLLGDTDLIYQKMSHNIYDNSKIKTLLPHWHAEVTFNDGVGETLQWLFESPARQRINPLLNDLIMQLTHLNEWK